MRKILLAASLILVPTSALAQTAKVDADVQTIDKSLGKAIVQDKRPMPPPTPVPGSSKVGDPDAICVLAFSKAITENQSSDVTSQFALLSELYFYSGIVVERYRSDEELNAVLLDAVNRRKSEGQEMLGECMERALPYGYRVSAVLSPRVDAVAIHEEPEKQ